MIIVKVHSSEWGDIEVYKVVSENFKIEPKDIGEFKCVRGDVWREKVNVDKKFVECVKNYGADIVFVLECEFGYPQAVLIFLKEKKIIHYFTLKKEAGLWAKLDWYREGKHIIRI
ncbi:MAG: hypothetical protein DRJ18_02105 [Candidatus Methanomethylicota archaeon]|nr:MAG: hypothetical protein DRJ18_02105 [Candidatus Verstraetearchaeota archaeon]